MSEWEAIAKLAELVGEIADRCWIDLGTDASTRIQRDCLDIVAAVPVVGGEDNGG